MSAAGLVWLLGWCAATKTCEAREAPRDGTGSLRYSGRGGGRAARDDPSYDKHACSHAPAPHPPFNALSDTSRSCATRSQAQWVMLCVPNLCTVKAARASDGPTQPRSPAP